MDKPLLLREDQLKGPADEKFPLNFPVKDCKTKPNGAE
jgi:hypothetical protein